MTTENRDHRDQVGLTVWSLLLRTHAALVPQLNRDLERQGHLPLAWYDVLLELNAAPERRLRMQDLGARVVLSRSRASRVVDELTAAGLACREPDSADRRGSFAALTDAGRQALRAAAPVYLAGIADRFSAHLTDQELTALREGLNRVLAVAQSEQTTGATGDRRRTDS
ncbi:MarR family winged helix-turn-helix transcriptional regulator [uncultured Friedmanniella sp.]|uniref:MarR family winged helix-turn-helix transcriptional regulator n=1 Tax=uncultured Friedmanniella sp. TaxID=335381 RepID=UPI0035CC6C5C